MQNKIKVLFHLDQAGYGGTEKAILTFCKNIDKDRYDVYLYVRRRYSDLRRLWDFVLGIFINKYKERYIRKYISSLTRLQDFIKEIGVERVFVGGIAVFQKCAENIEPHIVHFNRGNWDSFYEVATDVIGENTYIVETNIFGVAPYGRYKNKLSKVYFVSQWLKEKSSDWCQEKGVVLYNPIIRPVSDEDYRIQLGIKEDAFVFGRISRPDMIDDEFILKAYDRIKNKNIYMLVLGATDAIIKNFNNRENVILLEPTCDEAEISRFYNTINVLLHHRIEGETFGMNIAEAMMHGKAVISHESINDNAQIEVLNGEIDGDVGLISYSDTIEEYSGYMRKLMIEPDTLEIMGGNAIRRSRRLFSEELVTDHLMGEYENLIKH